MSRWFRHYAGMMRDEKLVRAAVRSSQPVERVIWVWGAILESAAEINDGGRYDFDAAEAGYFLRSSADDIQAILDALVSLGRLDGNVVAKWGDRQFESDSAAARQQRYRDRQKPRHNGGVTAEDRNGDGGVTPQETETETEGLLTQSSGEAQNVSREVETSALRAWNEAAQRLSLPKAQLLRTPRRTALHARLRELGGIDGWRAMIEMIGKSPHLLGDNDRGWKVTFDWILKPANLTKIMEGNYVRAKTNRPNTIAAGFDDIDNAIRERGFAGVTDREEDPFGLPRLRQGAA